MGPLGGPLAELSWSLSGGIGSRPSNHLGKVFEYIPPYCNFFCWRIATPICLGKGFQLWDSNRSCARIVRVGLFPKSSESRGGQRFPERISLAGVATDCAIVAQLAESTKITKKKAV